MPRRPQAWRGSVYRRGSRLYLKTKNDLGRWVSVPTPYSVGEEAKAEALLRSAREAVAPVLDVTGGSGLLTVERYARRWLERRPEQYRGNDEGSLEAHVFPALGPMDLRAVRPKHLVELVRGMEAKPRAPKTILNVYSLVQAIFREAVIEEVVETSPCILRKPYLPGKEDRDPEWRSGAVFSREELSTLISPHPKIEPDSTVCYALLGLGMLRHGEMAGLRWRNYHPETKPLGRIIVGRSYARRGTKTVLERWMPAHPVLAAVLAEWRLRGWASLMGRVPGPDDLILPLPVSARRKAEMMRRKDVTWKRADRHFDALGWRHRRVHDLRRTGISLARADGADRDVLRRGTHAPPKDVMELYTSVEWERLCAEVAKLKIARTKLATVMASGGPRPGRRST